MPTLNTRIAIGVEAVAWANIEDPELSMEDAVAELLTIPGNEILEVDTEGRRIKILHTNDVALGPSVDMIEVYECAKCPFYSQDLYEAVGHEEGCEG